MSTVEYEPPRPSNIEFLVAGECAFCGTKSVQRPKSFYGVLWADLPEKMQEDAVLKRQFYGWLFGK